MSQLLEYCDPPNVIAEWREQQRDSWTDDVRPLELRVKRTLEEVAPTTARPLDQRFQEQAEKWERETAFLSATPMRVLHNSYQSIMAMGPEVVPLLLRDLQQTGRHWFWALRHLTNADPVPEKDRGDIERMIAAWVKWGRMEGK